MGLDLSRPTKITFLAPASPAWVNIENNLGEIIVDFIFHYRHRNEGAGMCCKQITKRGLTMGKVLCAIFMLLGFAGMSHAEGAKANPRYVIKGGTIYDKKSGRTWERCSIGQQWKNKKLGCVGIVKSFVFEDAQLLGEKGWRVPSADELASLIDYNRKDQNQPPMIDEVAFPDMNKQKMVYWTSTPFEAADAFFVDFNVGNLDSDSRKTANAVRLVKGKQ